MSRRSVSISAPKRISRHHPRTWPDEGKGDHRHLQSELPELLAVSDRILVMRDGVTERVLDRARDRGAGACRTSRRSAGGGREIADAEEMLQRIVQGV